MKVSQIRLSSNDVIWEVNYVSVNLWRDRVAVSRFSYCSPSCQQSKEHDYNFDGQVFSRKSVNYQTQYGDKR